MGQFSSMGGGRGLSASVIVPTYNRREMLEWTLSSLVNQAPGAPDFEVLVCDDGSSDDTQAAALAFGNRLNLRYFFQEDRGYRVASARNMGIDAARGDICIFLDCGVVARKDFVRAHVEAHAAEDGPAAVIGYVHGFDEKDSEGHTLLSILDPRDPEASVRRMQGGFPDMRVPFYHGCDNDLGRLPAPWVYFWTCNVSAPRTEIVRAGRFDEAYQSWGTEDLDLGYCLHRLGLRFKVAWEAEAIHCPHPRDVEGNMKSDAANKAIFHRRHMDFRSEAMLLCSDTVLNQVLADFTALWALRPAVPIHPTEAAALPPLQGRSGKRLVAGTGRLERPDPSLATHYLEADTARMTQWAARHPGMHFWNLLGAATPFEDREFETVIIPGEWDLLPQDWRKRLFPELGRISKMQVYLVSHGDREAPIEAVRDLYAWAASAGCRIEAGERGSLGYLACMGSPPQ